MNPDINANDTAQLKSTTVAEHLVDQPDYLFRGKPEIVFNENDVPDAVVITDYLSRPKFDLLDQPVVVNVDRHQRALSPATLALVAAGAIASQGQARMFESITMGNARGFGYVRPSGTSSRNGKRKPNAKAIKRAKAKAKRKGR